MKNLILILLLIVSIDSFCQDEEENLPVVLNPRCALLSTFLIQSDTGRGTCFLVYYKSKQYLATVRHLFRKKVKSGDKIEFKLLVDKVMTSFNSKVYFHENDDVDIAIIPMDNWKSEFSTCDIMPEKITLGQECLFLGFPYGTMATSGPKYFFPLVKKAIISGLDPERGIIYFDGMNNKGFSGGPILTYFNDKHQPYILAIVSSYIPDEKSKDGSINTNSGIMQGYKARFIFSIINKISP
jgi:hypothetical protein